MDQGGRVHLKEQEDKTRECMAHFLAETSSNSKHTLCDLNEADALSYPPPMAILAI